MLFLMFHYMNPFHRLDTSAALVFRRVGRHWLTHNKKLLSCKFKQVKTCLPSLPVFIRPLEQVKIPGSWRYERERADDCCQTPLSLWQFSPGQSSAWDLQRAESCLPLQQTESSVAEHISFPCQEEHERKNDLPAVDELSASCFNPGTICVCALKMKQPSAPPLLIPFSSSQSAAVLPLPLWHTQDLFIWSQKQKCNPLRQIRSRANENMESRNTYHEEPGNQTSQIREAGWFL